MLERLDISGLTPSELHRGGYSSSIYETEHDTSILVKEVNSIWRPGKVGIKDYDDNLFYEEVGGDLQLLLDPKYGLARFIPPTSLAWGNNMSGKECGFIIMKKVQGEMIYDAWDIDHGVAGEIDKLLTGAIAMGTDNLNLERGVRKIPDIINGAGFINIMIGTTDANPKIQPYIIDTYPSSLAIDYKRETWDKALKLLSIVSKGFPFGNTRRALDSFFQSPQLVKLKPAE